MGDGRNVDTEELMSLEDKVRIGELAIGYDLGRNGGDVVCAACVDVVRRE